MGGGRKKRLWEKYAAEETDKDLFAILRLCAASALRKDIEVNAAAKTKIIGTMTRFGA